MLAYTVDYGVPSHEINMTTAQDGKYLLANCLIETIHGPFCFWPPVYFSESMHDMSTRVGRHGGHSKGWWFVRVRTLRWWLFLIQEIIFHIVFLHYGAGAYPVIQGGVGMYS